MYQMDGKTLRIGKLVICKRNKNLLYEELLYMRWMKRYLHRVSAVYLELITLWGNCCIKDNKKKRPAVHRPFQDC